MDEVAIEREQELDEARSAERKRWRRYFAAMSVFATGMLITGVGFSLGDGDEGKPYRHILSWLIGGGLLAVVCGLTAMIMFKSNTNTERLLAASSSRDRAQRQQAEQILIMPAVSLYLTFKGVQGAWAVLSGRADLHDWMFALSGPVLSIVLLATVANIDNRSDRGLKRLLDDELVRSFRHRSLMLAFSVLVAGFVGVFAAALWSPKAAISAMPLVLAVAAAAAAIRFALLDHEADLND